MCRLRLLFRRCYCPAAPRQPAAVQVVVRHQPHAVPVVRLRGLRQLRVLLATARAGTGASCSIATARAGTIGGSADAATAQPAMQGLVLCPRNALPMDGLRRM